MGTRMYCYRVSRKDWWIFANNLREYYLNEAPFGMAMKHYWKEMLDCDTPRERVAKLMELSKIWIKDSSIDLQVFDEGDSYLFRVLEAGYFFMNHREEFSIVPIEEVFYDDHSDMTDEMMKHYATVDWVDERINKHEYFVYTVVGETDWANGEYRKYTEKEVKEVVE